MLFCFVPAPCFCPLKFLLSAPPSLAPLAISHQPSISRVWGPLTIHISLHLCMVPDARQDSINAHVPVLNRPPPKNHVNAYPTAAKIDIHLLTSTTQHKHKDTLTPSSLFGGPLRAFPGPPSRHCLRLISLYCVSSFFFLKFLFLFCLIFTRLAFSLLLPRRPPPPC